MAYKRRLSDTRQDLNLILGSPVKIECDPPLKIELVEKPINEKERLLDKKLFWILIFIIFGLVILIVIGYIFYIYPQEAPPFKFKPLSVNTMISYPTYIFRGDEATIKLTLINEKAETLKNLKAVLIPSEGIPIEASLKGSTSANYGNLSNGERKTRAITIFLHKTVKEKEIEFRIKLISEGNQEELLNPVHKMKVISLLVPKTTIISVLSILMLGVIFPVITDIVKEWLKNIISKKFGNKRINQLH